jgi:hypothetical protein
MAYDKFGAYALLEHRGDLTAAAKALYVRGYRGEHIHSPTWGRQQSLLGARYLPKGVGQ